MDNSSFFIKNGRFPNEFRPPKKTKEQLYEDARKRAEIRKQREDEYKREQAIIAMKTKEAYDIILDDIQQRKQSSSSTSS